MSDAQGAQSWGRLPMTIDDREVARGPTASTADARSLGLHDPSVIRRRDPRRGGGAQRPNGRDVFMFVPLEDELEELEARWVEEEEVGAWDSEWERPVFEHGPPSTANAGVGFSIRPAGGFCQPDPQSRFCISGRVSRVTRWSAVWSGGPFAGVETTSRFPPSTTTTVTGTCWMADTESTAWDRLASGGQSCHGDGS